MKIATLWKVSNYRPPAIIRRDPLASTYEVGDDKYAAMTAQEIVAEHNALVEHYAKLVRAAERPEISPLQRQWCQERGIDPEIQS